MSSQSRYLMTSHASRNRLGDVRRRWARGVRIGGCSRHDCNAISAYTHNVLSLLALLWASGTTTLVVLTNCFAGTNKHCDISNPPYERPVMVLTD